jgi:hypothetical protein
VWVPLRCAFSPSCLPKDAALTTSLPDQGESDPELIPGASPLDSTQSQARDIKPPIRRRSR